MDYEKSDIRPSPWERGQIEGRGLTGSWEVRG